MLSTVVNYMWEMKASQPNLLLWTMATTGISIMAITVLIVNAILPESKMEYNK